MSLSATNGQEAVNLIQAEHSNATEESDATSPRISLILMDCAMVIFMTNLLNFYYILIH